jgi:hypothetical protein
VACSPSKIEQLVDLCQHGGEGAIKDNILYCDC